MTDAQPARRTISFNTAQWRDVILGDIARLHETFKAAQQPLTEADLVMLDQHMNGIRAMIGAWNVEALKLAEAQAAAQANAPAKANGNGAVAAPVQTEPQVTPIPKKKGWPAGKPRGPRKPKVAAQQ